MLGTVPSKLGRGFSWITPDKQCRCFINIKNLPVGWVVLMQLQKQVFSRKVTCFLWGNKQGNKVTFFGNLWGNN